MALRLRTHAANDHGGRRLAYLALACAGSLLLLAVGTAHAGEATSSSPALLLTAPPLQVNSSGSPNAWSFSERPFSAIRSNAAITVNTPADALPNADECSGAGGDCSLRQAIDKASSGDEIELLQDTYEVTLGTLLVDKSVNIIGSGAATLIDGSGNRVGSSEPYRIMKIASGVTVGIAAVTMTGGVDDHDENFTGGAVSTVSLNGGGAIFNNGGTLSLADVRFFNNASNNPIGGAVATTGGSLTMANVTFANNGAGVAGSLRVRSGSVAGIGVTFTDSFGEFGGGSIYIDGGSLSLTNSTIDDSQGLNGFGIGIHNAGGQVTLTSVTIAHSQGYALLTDQFASTTIADTIIGLGGRGDCRQAGQPDSVTGATTAAAVTVDGGHNLDQNGDCGLSANGDLTGDPLLTSPGQFGGSTETDALRAGSPAIGGGSGCPPIDQRGITRSDPCDIGAFEFVAGAGASFTFAPGTPLDGETVTFTNTSSTSNTNATLSYLWDFGDGAAASTDASPTHAFAAPDHPVTYTVTLQVTDSSGSVDEISQDVTAHPANEQPIASFTFGAAAPNTPVQFDASASSDPDGSIAGYRWNWGDGSEDSSGVTQTHTYASAGTYTVTLTVTDNGERTDAVSQEVTVATPTVTDYFVDATWADNSDGDPVTGPQGQTLTFGTDAFATIGAALGAANNGDPNTTVHVAAGSYNEEGLSMTRRGLQLVGAAFLETHVHLTQLSVDGTDEVVRGLDLIGPGRDGGEGTGCLGCGTSPVVSLGGDENNDDEDVSQDALIESNRIRGGYIGIAFTRGNSENFPTSGSEASNNDIFGNVTGVTVDGGSNNLIEDNNIHDNGAINQAGTDQPQAGVLITDEQGNQPIGNVVIGNTIADSIANGISIRTSGNAIEDNTITGSGVGYPRFKEASGIELVAGAEDNVNDNVVSGNTVTGSAFAGIKIGDSTDGNTLSDNTITGTQHPGANGGGETPGGGGTAILLTGYGATNTTISGNTLGPNTGHGILQEGSPVGYSTGNVARQNSISGNALGGVLNNDAALFDAAQNWWGDASGPSGEGPGNGDSASDNVTFDPWLTCPPGTGDCANQSPAASFSASPSSTPGSLQVAVDGSASVDPDGMIVSYAWDFGDDSTASGATASHTYASGGTYTIRLTVTDDRGAADTVTQQVTVPAVAANQPPQASLAATPSTEPGSLQVVVDGSGSVDQNAAIASYAWDFGDGTTATGATASHTYASAGTYTITLTVTDSNGATDTTTRQVTVPATPPSQAPQQPPANQAPHASFVLTPPGVAGSLQVAVDGSGSTDPDGTIASYAWSFGDNAGATGATASHAYAAAGTFTITLTVTDNNGATDTASQQVTVPVPGAPAPPLPPPVKGVSVDVYPFIGTVLVNGLPLVAGQQIPFGATIDTTHGTILLQDISPSGELEAAYFAGAVFKLLTTPAGLTQLVLQGGDFSVCTANSKRHAATAGKPPKKKTVVRSLWGNGHGQFVTKGRFAAATVRGTIWNTQDRCDGTFVNVQRGIVGVQDLVRNKTTNVTAGHTLLVPAP